MTSPIVDETTAASVAPEANTEANTDAGAARVILTGGTMDAEVEESVDPEPAPVDPSLPMVPDAPPGAVEHERRFNEITAQYERFTESGERIR